MPFLAHGQNTPFAKSMIFQSQHSRAVGQTQLIQKSTVIELNFMLNISLKDFVLMSVAFQFHLPIQLTSHTSSPDRN